MKLSSATLLTLCLALAHNTSATSSRDYFGPRINAAPSVVANDAPKNALDSIHRWNQIAIDASGLDHTPVAPGELRTFGEQLGPGRASRAMAIVHIAIFDSVNAVLGGWELTTITLLETGPWLTPSISDSFDQSNTDVVNRGAFLRPDQVSTNFYQGQSRGQYFNLAAFAPTPAGASRFGNAGVGILQGPGTIAASLGLAKVFRVTEAVRMRFESTFTNVLNHSNFAPPATQIDVPSTFGVLSAPQTAENAGNRTGQLALRIEF